MPASAASLTAIQKVYIAYYGRPADPIGLDYWATRLDAANGNLSTIINAFGTSAEATARYAGQSTATMINNLYLQMFNRAAEPAGLSWWVQQVTSGNYTVATVMLAVLAGAQGADATVIAGKLASADLYTAAMDTTAEILAYQGTAAADAGRAFLAPVGATAVTAAAADSAVATMVAGSVPPPVNQTFTLTTGVDKFTGGAGADVFNSTDTTVTGLDILDGGDGADTLNVSDVAGSAATLSLLTVKNIETLSLQSTKGLKAGAADVSSWTGLTAANFTLLALDAAQTITAANTTAVTVTETQTAAFSTTVIGGSTVTVNNTYGTSGTALNNSASTITVTGTAGTTSKLTSVTVNQTDASSGATGKSAMVAISDPATTTDALATVSITGGSSGTAATIGSDVLTTLNLTKSADGATITAAAGTRALALNLNGITAGTVTDATATTVNVVNSGAASTGTLTAAAAKSVTIGGDKALTLTALNGAAMTSLAVNASALTTISAYGTTNKLATVTVTGAGGLTTNLSTQGAQLTSVDASASSGANTVILNTTTAYTGGSGDDTVVLSAAPTLAITGGSGNDTLVMNAASFAITKATGFETLGLGTAATGAYSAAGFTGLTQGAVAAAVTYNSVAAGTGLTFTGDPGFATTYNLATDTAADTLNLTLKSAGVLAGNSLTATTVETVNITLTDTDTTKHVNTLTLVDTTLATLNVSGNAGLVLTNTNTTVKAVDASGMTNTAGTAGTGFTWTTGALANASTIKGSATGGDVINAAAAAAATTITVYAGTNSITGSATKASILTGGTGADTIIGGAAADTIVGGGGADLITGAAGADKITVSGNTATIIYTAAGESGANNATLTQTALLTSTFDVIYGLTAGAKITLGTLLTGAATVTADLVLTNATNLQGTADKVVFAKGTYDSANGLFNYGAAGLDTAMTFDNDGALGGGTYETVILVGYSVGSTTTAAAGIITLA